MEKTLQDVQGNSELLAKQLIIFKQYGLSPKERTFQQFLKEIKSLIRRTPSNPPTCFFSYAWDLNPDVRKQVQGFIERMAKDMRKLNIEVFFDLDCMTGDLRETMRANIMRSNMFILVCSPHWKLRIEEGLTPTLLHLLENDLVDELESGLSQTPIPVDFNPLNNVTFELVHIWMKSKRSKIIPFCVNGSWRDSTTPFLKRFLIRDGRGALTNDEDYYELLTGSNPLGVIPDMCGLYNTSDYESCWDKFISRVEFINRKFT